MDDCPTREVHSSLLDLDDTHGKIGVVQPLVHHQLPPSPRVIQSTVEFVAILWTCVFMSMVRYCATCHDFIGEWSC